MKSANANTRKAVTITLPQAAIDALAVISALDHRNKSQQIEYLILQDVANKGATVAGYAPTTTTSTHEQESNKVSHDVSTMKYNVTNGTVV